MSIRESLFNHILTVVQCRNPPTLVCYSTCQNSILRMRARAAQAFKTWKSTAVEATRGLVSVKSFRGCAVLFKYLNMFTGIGRQFFTVLDELWHLVLLTYWVFVGWRASSRVSWELPELSGNSDTIRPFESSVRPLYGQRMPAWSRGGERIELGIRRECLLVGVERFPNFETIAPCYRLCPGVFCRRGTFFSLRANEMFQASPLHACASTRHN